MQKRQFWVYHNLLRRHNALLNLTRIHNFDNMVLKLYVDSVLPARLTELPSPLMDLGTGPGMPGIPLKIMNPGLEVLLAESRAKRAAFLEEAVEELGLGEVHVVRRTITPAFDRPVAGVITRAVEAMAKTLERVQGCLRQNGRVVFMKGPECGREIEEALAALGDRFSLVQDQRYRIGGTTNLRRIVVFERQDAPPSVKVDRARGRHRVLTIESEANARFKSLRKLLTGRGVKKASEAVMSGKRQILEALARHPDRCLAWISSGPKSPPPEESPEGMQWLQLSGPLFEQLDVFGTRSPLLVLRVPPIPAWTPEQGFEPGCNLLIPFQDPENVGSVLRSAAAFGVAQVILLAESAHPYHPKSLRTSGGAATTLKLKTGPALDSLPGDLPVLALSSDGSDIGAARFPGAFGLLAGMEGRGLPERWRSRALRIPIQPAVESLNAAAAVAVALYEWSRSAGRDQARSP